MKILLATVLLCLVGNITWASGQGFDTQNFEDFRRYSDSGIFGPEYAQMLASLSRVAQQKGSQVEVMQYGVSLQGRPLTVFKLKRKTVAQPKVILVTGATHGNEYLAIADRLTEQWMQAPSQKVDAFLEAGNILYMIPVFNPDGYDNRTRGNSKGKDLNRDFSLETANFVAFSQQETQSWAQFLDQELAAQNGQLVLTMDYHCCDGSLLYPWAYTMNPLPAKDLAAHQAVGEIMKSIFPGYRYGSTGQVLGYTPLGTSKDYYYEQYGALSFTFEGDYRVEKNLFAKHLQMWDQILATWAP